MIFPNFLNIVSSCVKGTQYSCSFIYKCLCFVITNDKPPQFLKDTKLFGKLQAIAKGSSKDKVLNALTAFESDPAVRLFSIST